MDTPIEIVERSTQHTVAIRTRSDVKDLPNLLPRTYSKLMHYLNGVGVPVADPPYAYAAYYNVDMEDLDIEAGFPVDVQVEGKGNIMAGEIPAGRFATVVHTGPYEELEPTYKRLSAWISQHQAKPAGVVYEMYLNGPDDTPPEGLQTRILMLLN